MKAVDATEPTLEQIEREKVTDFSTAYPAWCNARGVDPLSRRTQLRYLESETGLTRPQSKAMIRAYELDQRDAVRDVERRVRYLSFVDWLMRQAPSTRKPSVKKREWRCAS